MTAPLDRAMESINSKVEEIYASEKIPTNLDLAKAVLSSVDPEALAKVVRDHRRNKAINFGRGYACLCGEVLQSNSHYVQADHIAEAVKNHLTGETP